MVFTERIKTSQNLKNFTAAFFLSLTTTLMPGEKRRSCDGKAFFRFVESKLQAECSRRKEKCERAG